jgi:streptomycin 6-kinase
MSWEAVLKELADPKTWEYWDGPPSVEKILQIVQTMDEKVSSRYSILYKLMTLLYHTGRINKLGWDLHTENVMKRADGSLVVIDPWFALGEY